MWLRPKTVGGGLGPKIGDLEQGRGLGVTDRNPGKGTGPGNGTLGLCSKLRFSHFSDGEFAKLNRNLGKGILNGSPRVIGLGIQKS